MIALNQLFGITNNCCLVHGPPSSLYERQGGNSSFNTGGSSNLVGSAVYRIQRCAIESLKLLVVPGNCFPMA